MQRRVPIGNLARIGIGISSHRETIVRCHQQSQFYRIQSFTGYSAQALYPLRKRVPIRQPLGLPWKQERNAAASRPRGQDQPKEKSRPIATVHQRRHQLADLDHHRSKYIQRVLESERPTVQPTVTYRPTFFRPNKTAESVLRTTSLPSVTSLRGVDDTTPPTVNRCSVRPAH